MQFSLNKKQEEAVKYRGGPLLIIAGAGTGKTAVITQRIIDLVNSRDAKATEILALTFTEKAAAEMIERVDLEMPSGYEEAHISTFHSFCDSVLRQDGGYLGLDTGYTLMNQAQSYILFRKHLFEMPLDILRPIGNPAQNINSILKHFSRLQDEDVTPEEYLEFSSNLPGSTEEEIARKETTIELAKSFELYTQIKLKESKLDFGDLINQTLRLFRERPNVLEKYQKMFKYILVDEFQDTNYTQNVLVNVLVLGKGYEKASKKDKKNAQITVVGDDDQAIYKFRGAAISNILHFNDIYSESKKIVLTENYRSRQGILDSAYQLIQRNDPDRLEVTEDINKKLISKVPEVGRNGFLKLLIADTATEEADLVAKQILKLTGNIDMLKNDNSIIKKQYDEEGQSMFVDIDKNSENFNFSDISILVRAHSHSDEFVQILKHYGIPFKFGGARGLYTRPEVGFLISFLKILADYTDDMSMFNLIKNPIWGFTPRETLEILRLAREEKVSIFEFLEQSWGVKAGEIEGDISTIDIPNIIKKVLSEKSISEVSKVLSIFDNSIKDLSENSSIGEVLFLFFKESGYMESLLQNEDAQTQFMVQNISKYFEMLKQYEQNNPEGTVTQYVDYLKYSIEIGETPSVDSDVLEDYNAVNIMTVHGAKGLEFPVVFMVNLVSDRFPTRNRSDKFPMPEELIKDVIADVDPRTEHLREERRLFYVGATRAKQKLFLTAAKYYGEGKRMKKPSLFLDELLNRKVSDDFSKEGTSAAKKDQFTVMVSSYDDNLELSEIPGIDPIYISYSHLNTFLLCPKKYKYQYVLRVPEPPSYTLAFGRTIHNTLQDFYTEQKHYIDGLKGVNSPPTLDDLLNSYESKWISEGYESKRHEQLRKEHGSDMLKTYFKEMYNEEQKPIQLEHRFKYKINDLIIKGSIDRIDLIEEGEVPKVEIIDYKTGKAHSQKEAEENLQLALYSLVAAETLGFEIAKASLIYVEHGVKISIEIDDEKRSLVKKQVTEIIDDIRTRDFTATPGFHCNYCGYRDICEDAQL